MCGELVVTVRFITNCCNFIVHYVLMLQDSVHVTCQLFGQRHSLDDYLCLVPCCPFLYSFPSLYSFPALALGHVHVRGCAHWVSVGWRCSLARSWRHVQRLHQRLHLCCGMRTALGRFLGCLGWGSRLCAAGDVHWWWAGALGSPCPPHPSKSPCPPPPLRSPCHPPPTMQHHWHHRNHYQHHYQSLHHHYDDCRAPHHRPASRAPG